MDLHEEFLSLLEIGARSDDENEDDEVGNEGKDDANQEEVKDLKNAEDTTMAATNLLHGESDVKMTD